MNNCDDYAERPDLDSPPLHHYLPLDDLEPGVILQIEAVKILNNVGQAIWVPPNWAGLYCGTVYEVVLEDLPYIIVEDANRATYTLDTRIHRFRRPSKEFVEKSLELIKSNKKGA